MRGRRELVSVLLSTAAIVLLLVWPSGAAAGPPAPNARPSGGHAVAGSATITATPSTTTINQSSQRAAINWQSFDVGSNQTVNVDAPSSSAVTVMRVRGPDPSSLAGRINANGIVVITNPSGAAIYKGAQVNADSFLLFAPGITNKNFVAAQMVFDQVPKPNAMITNEGTITVKQAGLAATMAPAVRNSGVVNGRLARVALLAGKTVTMDFFGNGLPSADITEPVRQAPVGANGRAVSSLVTQSGTVYTDGGSTLIEAAAADGVVQKLISNSGLVRAQTIGSRTGGISMVGVGGSIAIGGKVQATGPRALLGGTIAVRATGTVRIGVKGRLNTSGGSGGGTIALGTHAGATAKNGIPAGTSRMVTVPAGAVLAANATRNGNGGAITCLATQTLVFAGTAAVRGGRTAGDGGTIELSSGKTVTLTGATLDTSAPHGQQGSVVLDPRKLIL